MQRALCLAMGLAITTMTASAMAACPDYQTPENPPAAPQAPRQGFRHFGSRLLAGLYKPTHMMHDVMVASGQPITLVGKFDYDPVLHKDLEDERIHVYVYGTGMAGWEYAGNRLTDRDGKIYLDIGTRPVGDYRVRMVVEGDGTVAEGWLSVVEKGREAVLFDIDGTLTINDFEAYADYAGLKTATPYYYAPEVVRAYQQKGYQIIYLTARPYWVTRDAREWFPKMGLLSWHYHSNPYGGGPIPPNTEQFKTDYVRYLRDTVGLKIIRAYGNATTDISAYANGGIAKADTFIIGQHAGKNGTNALGGDYTWHFSQVVTPTPNAACKR
ncbi:lipin/Ned1/Smp2 family protein [Parachitinimonas caeni]|uniref:LNS2/PITP domain-containing protein n=1 Tax=Parachitinimonas caeni TaxID=3031301 RepID=A0ABT7E266_9NEIS|nr:hypothetical protein [Parachitinimonas caeni]MDK2126144.1 hypothetical protein [Parachitinimonas caeni]